jgi:hypothetical protein
MGKTLVFLIWHLCVVPRPARTKYHKRMAQSNRHWLSLSLGGQMSKFVMSAGSVTSEARRDICFLPVFQLPVTPVLLYSSVLCLLLAFSTSICLYVRIPILLNRLGSCLVWVCSGCHNKMPEASWLVHNSSLVLTVLETAESKIRGLADLVSGECLLFVS